MRPSLPYISTPFPINATTARYVICREGARKRTPPRRFGPQQNAFNIMKKKANGQLLTDFVAPYKDIVARRTHLHEKCHPFEKRKDGITRFGKPHVIVHNFGRVFLVSDLFFLSPETVEALTADHDHQHNRKFS